ncbi:phage major capsid protein [Sandaracinobacter sp.]|uniref:phage major capsid protein n=1 Tax=Sandaracinobacter sp. TaxID=2487581 RepID=UPI0035B09E9F
MKTADLIEERGALVARMRAAHEADKADDFTTAEAELRSLDARLARAKALDAMDAAAPKRDEKFTAVLSDYRLTRHLAWVAGLPGIDAGREREVDAELRSSTGRQFQGVAVPTELFEKRVLTTAAPAGGPGSNLVPTDHLAGEYISALTASTVIAGLGARTLTGLMGNVEIPGEKAAPTAGWIAENAALTASDPQFRQVTLAPKHVGSLSEFSRNMLLQTSPGIEGILRQMMARDIALEMDRVAILGGGSNEPTGILAAAGTQTQAYATSLFHTGAEMIGKANVANVGPNRAFLSSNRVATIARKTLDSQKLPIGTAALFHGERAEFSNLVPDTLGAGTNESGLIYGDFSELLIGLWSALDVLVNPYESTAYSKGNVMIRAMATADIALRNPQAFVKATGVLAAAVGIA